MRYSVEERFLQRLLDFCKEAGVIALYKFDDERIFIVIESEPRTYTTSEAMELLIGAVEEQGHFYDTLRA